MGLWVISGKNVGYWIVNINIFIIFVALPELIYQRKIGYSLCKGNVPLLSERKTYYTKNTKLYARKIPAFFLAHD